ncbi:hypothetical protein PF005_g1953 [Phytophthora fragariae]|uniref:Uncharacterized protein n=1 Tax=Phytophthora fragariae TaxID=53985 RepID=A0A6A3V538_9STRA|nr:hypothetical protein PF003_g9900 [Phytophthora fragariae]KAE8948513.1 hypothetical protein PF009_g1903 [Phytophthora fragariae]KAE9122650.1 hypothetical protein PF007_g7377 [Phytophthora fragariae]KAE9154526.1 hypothetical protein PF006_g1443 [Phytophthora fragariae]KAE9234312.1 hypothetical protein PF005_g1953 [Phytophthora fragariae]
MERLGYSVYAILAKACDTQREWDLQDLGDGEGADAICLIRDRALLEIRPGAQQPVGPALDDAKWRTVTPEFGLHGEDTAAQVAAILAERVDEAAAAGLNAEQVETLSALLYEYRDVFRVSFGSDPPVRVEPLRVRLHEGAAPVRINARRYPPTHMEYLDQHVQELPDNGLAYVNPSRRWASPPLIVPKNEPDTFRMTVDLSAVNERTDPNQWPMPMLDSALGLLEGPPATSR